MQADERRFNVIWSIHFVLITVQAAASCSISYTSQKAALFLVKSDILSNGLGQKKREKNKLEMLKRKKMKKIL